MTRLAFVCPRGLRFISRAGAKVMNRIDRLLGDLLLFQGRGRLRAQDFAAKFEISERTVYRDMLALGEVGVPIVAVPGEGYRLMEGYYVPPIMFTQAGGRGLFLGGGVLA